MMRHEHLMGALTCMLVLSLTACTPEDGPPQSDLSPTAPAAPAQTPSPQPATGLIWSEEFDGASGSGLSPSTWVLMDRAGGFGNEELQAYTTRPENVSHDGNGALRITARAEDYVDPRGNRVAFTSGRVQTVPSFLYGRIEARIKVPAGAGLWSAFWTIGEETPAIQWPHVGEIDVMEIVDDARTVHADVHANTDDNGHWSWQGQLPSETPYSADWHVYSVDWSEDSLVFAVDGTVYHTVEKSKIEPFQVWAFDRPQHVILNVAVGGSWPQDPNDPSVFPAEMLVDYVRAYDTEIHGPSE